jgi:hypothetical protein
LFADDAIMTDDGNSRDLAGFTSASVGVEKFLTIDSVTNDGRHIVGDFNAGKWGKFKVFFRFTLGDDGKISRLDIGQA